ncbi:hypothetical protein V1272_001431 [Bradyrhizobium sp. AZCC 1708]
MPLQTPLLRLHHSNNGEIRRWSVARSYYFFRLANTCLQASLSW